MLLKPCVLSFLSFALGCLPACPCSLYVGSTPFLRFFRSLPKYHAIPPLASTSFLSSLFLVGVLVPSFPRAILTLRLCSNSILRCLSDFFLRSQGIGSYCCCLSPLSPLLPPHNLPFLLVHCGSANGPMVSKEKIHCFVLKRDVLSSVLWWQKTRLKCEYRYSGIIVVQFSVRTFWGPRFPQKTETSVYTSVQRY